MKIIVNKEFACKLSVMLDSKLIWYKHYQLFCDDIIQEYTKPPYWVIELSIVRFQAAAVDIVNKYIHSEPFLEINYGDLSDQYIACLYLKYVTREISWANFLFSSGQHSDSCQSVKESCEYFYELLNEYEDSDFNTELEQKQKNEIYVKFINEIDEIDLIYQMFKEYYQKFITRKEYKK
ncbi:hypothetical protein [Paenibacillus sp. IHBB 10380]|uniref:hypothetical protein n=1 Tax=Paenibacillus sp. IHBB 10380 TaxID=1566358 RepID=UPI0005CFDC95|nr:hypothetical protein [Paenibacillus sp. IHBB 10380]AJS58816.1 hypothetical protein UB51_10400 [Paenibacillus sp. IHBB 10380]